jgi:hypothetical protein
MEASKVEERESPVYSKTKKRAIRRMALAEGGSMKIHKKNNRSHGRLRRRVCFTPGVEAQESTLASGGRQVYTASWRSGMAERIGDYLVRTGAMQQSQVESVIAAQKAGDSRTFGELAVALGFASRAAVDACAASRS